MADPKGFLKHGREVADPPAGRGAGARLERGLPRRHRPRAAADHHDPGRALHGLRHPVLPPGLPAGQHHPGVERPGLARRLGRRDRAPARDQQLPGVHRAAVPRAVRDRLRAGHQPGPGDDQERRGRDHRQGLGVRPGPAPAAGVALGPHRGRGRLRAGRAGRRPAADPSRPRGGGLRAGRPHRRAAALRHPRVQDGEEAPRPAPRADAPRGHRLPGRRRRGLRRARRRPAPRPVRRRRARHGLDRSPATCRSRAASSVASTRRWSTCRRPTGSQLGQDVPDRDQITATGKHVVIIGGGDTGADCLGTSIRQGARSITQLEIMPSRPRGAPRASRGRRTR